MLAATLADAHANQRPYRGVRSTLPHVLEQSVQHFHMLAAAAAGLPKHAELTRKMHHQVFLNRF